MYHYSPTFKNSTFSKGRQHEIQLGVSQIILVLLILSAFIGFVIFHFSRSHNSIMVTSSPSEDEVISKCYYDTLINKPDNDVPRVFAAEESTDESTATPIQSEPEISGKSGIVVEADSGRVLFDKNSGERLKLASLTKIMTAVVALEHKSLSDKLTVSDKAATIGENAMGISTGEAYTLEELMYGLLLNSGNDAAYAIAEGVAGDSDTFVKWMNMKSAELGLHNTYFADPSGLDDSSYTTARDLVVLTEYAMRFSEFRQIVATFSKELPYSDEHKELYLENQTNLLTTYPGDIGVKTGYTEEAGLCLVSYAVNGGKEMIGVVLGSSDRKGDMVLMLDHSFDAVGVHVEHPKLIFSN